MARTCCCSPKRKDLTTKAQLTSIQLVDSELASLQAKAAALQTDGAAYSKALEAALPAIGGSDTIKL